MDCEMRCKTESRTGGKGKLFAPVFLRHLIQRTLRVHILLNSCLNAPRIVFLTPQNRARTPIWKARPCIEVP